MQFSDEQKQLIEKIIRENEKFQGREDLLESFFAEVYKKSYLLLGSVSNVENLRNYLTKVIDTSISNVLGSIEEKRTENKIANRVESRIEKMQISKDMPSFEDIKVIPKKILDSIPKDFKPSSLKEADYSVRSLRGEIDVYKDIKDPAFMVKQEVINKNLAQKIVNIIYEIHSKVPQRYYFHLFYMKYIEKKKQGEIAQKLGVTQNELSKRYWELVKLIKENL